MSASERAVIYVESGTDLSSLAVAASSAAVSKNGSGRHANMSSLRTLTDHPKTPATTTAVVTTAGPGCGSNYVIKIQIGEENMFNPVRIDVSTGKGGQRTLRQSQTVPIEDDSQLSSSGQSSPRSDMTPPPRINSGAIRFGSETSESDTESDVSSEFRPVPCQAAQFALREICEVDTPSPPPMPRSIMKNPLKSGSNASSGYKSPQFQVSGNKQRSANGGSEFMSLGGMRGSPESPSRRLKSLSGRSSIISPECIKAKAELDAEILKRGKLIAAGTTTLATAVAKKSIIIRKEKLVHIPENKVSHNISPRFVEKNVHTGDQEGAILTEPNGFHLNEINECNNKESVVNEGGGSESLSNFAGYRDIFTRNTGANPIMSEKGTIRGVKNRVRDGIATFLQTSDSKPASTVSQSAVKNNEEEESE
ncbi:unnamed protein product [Orchesella dallaii]|uniref:Uncharacterized protein n=1 Tax=Orchesella dallaii TaxID=48710 RepID=A0ABP1Q3Z3_9HEXA